MDWALEVECLDRAVEMTGRMFQHLDSMTHVS